MTTKSQSSNLPGSHLAALRQQLLAAYGAGELWGYRRPTAILPDGLERGSDPHLIFLTLPMAISPGREPAALWIAARRALPRDPELFDPHFLAHLNPADLKDLQTRLMETGLTGGRSDASTWQRIGEAIVMQGGGSVRAILEKHHYDADRLHEMLVESKATFPVLSGTQTAPRWLYALATDGGVELAGVDQLLLPLSPAADRATLGLQIGTDKFTVPVFDPLDALGRLGCSQRGDERLCPAARECPVADFCQFGSP